jgi:hypothetical protein
VDEPPAAGQRGARVGGDDGRDAADAACDAETDWAIRRLLARGLVELGIDRHGREAIRLTPAGRRVRAALDQESSQLQPPDA